MRDSWATSRATEAFLLFDYFRVPYAVEPDALAAEAGPLSACGRLEVERPDGSTAFIWWPRAGSIGPQQALEPGTLRWGGAPLWASALPDPIARQWLGGREGEWRPTERLCDRSGRRAASVWTDREGNVLLPFDPAEVMRALWSEAYLGDGRRRGASSLPLRAYYRARPAVPRRAQIALRRGYSRLQRRTGFPRWPVEIALHDLYAQLFSLISRAAHSAIPYLAAWPDGHEWAVVLTHDVETAAGCAAIPELCDLERELGFRSSWYFVPTDYATDDGLLRELKADGFEVGVHGLRHDGRDFASAAVFRERLPAIQRYATEWEARGFRSASSLRVSDWMPELGFDYDSSYSDTAPYEPQPGGCCSLLPFFNEGLVELPITLPQDHTLFEILGERDERVWLEKLEVVREHGGMALSLTHPDYTTPSRLTAYRRLLEACRDDGGAWHALPRDVSAWWRARAASLPEWRRGQWRVTGPAAEDGRVAFAGSSGLSASG